MINEIEIKELFNKAKVKYKNVRYLKNHINCFSLKSNIDVFYFDSEEKNNIPVIISFLKKFCKNKFQVQELSFISKIIGHRNLKIISKDDLERRKLYYVYYENFKDMLLVKLKRL